ncbi:MAG: ABC transporter permease [Lachnospiraceae bacterium]|nr:ABC transporter permease [Lachnospiraceae bacterium]
MYRFFFIAKNNIKKQKGDMITFFLLSFISAFLIFVSASFLAGGPKVVDDLKEKTNGADIIFNIGKDDFSESKLEEIIIGNENIAEYEKTEFFGAGAARNRKKGAKEWNEYAMQFISYEQEIKIQSCSADTKGLRGNEAVIPVRLSTSYAKGDIIQIKIDKNVYDLKVAGFCEDTYYCSPMNMGTYQVYVSDDMYNSIVFDNDGRSGSVSDAYKVTLTKAAQKKNIDTNLLGDKISGEHHDWATDYGMANGIKVTQIDNCLPYGLMRSASMILPYIFIAIVFAFALIIFVIAIVIIHFSIRNFIMNNMKNTAIMEAAGYTTGELVAILMCQLLIVSIAGSLSGVILGMITIGKLGIIMLVTLGLSWNQPANMTIALFVTIGILAVICLVTQFLGRDYKRISVLEALRGGINAHNFKKNFFPFEIYPFPVPVILSLKETFGKFRSQLGIIFIIMVLTMSTAVALGFSDTFVSSEDALLDVGGFTKYDGYTTGDEAFEASLKNMKTVETVYGETWNALSYSSNKVRDGQILTTVGITDTTVRVGGGLVEGRWPLHENELALGTNAALRLKVGIGDVLTVKNGAMEENYIVTGMCQVMNNMGMMVYLTDEGIKKVTPVVGYNYCITFKEGVDFDTFNAEFEDMFPEKEAQDYHKAAGATLDLIKIAMKATALLIMVLTVLIAMFVESLVIRTQITKSWRDLGVSKALGYTSTQLIGQTVLSNIPAVLIGVILGVILAKFAGPRVGGVIFMIFGYKKVSFTIYPISYIITFVTIIAVAMLTAGWIGRRIKGLEPVKMITEE